METPRKIPQNFIASPVDDEIVLIDMAGGELFSLKGAARATWDLIDGESSIEEIVGSLVAEYDVEPAEAAGDVVELLRELESAGLVAC